MIYEIINPSDPYCIEADDPKVACVAVAILGEGMYALKQGDEDIMPIFLVDPDEWFREQFRGSFGEVLNSIDRAVLAVCFDSVLCCEAGEYEEEKAALAKVPFYSARLARHDERRTSMNDIGRRAWALAERVRG